MTPELRRRVCDTLRQAFGVEVPNTRFVRDSSQDRGQEADAVHLRHLDQPLRCALCPAELLGDVIEVDAGYTYLICLDRDTCDRHREE